MSFVWTGAWRIFEKPAPVLSTMAVSPHHRKCHSSLSEMSEMSEMSEIIDLTLSPNTPEQYQPESRPCFHEDCTIWRARMRQQRREEVAIVSSIYALKKHAPPMSKMSEKSRRKVDFDAYA
jgi:hypothetical protein